MSPPRPPQQTRIYVETFRRVEPICETPNDPCVTVLSLVEDPVSQTSYIAETRECTAIVRRIPGLNLFESSPELRRRLEQLNHPHGTIQRPPQVTPRPQQPPTQLPPLPPAAPQPQPSAPPSAPHASRVAGAIVGIIGGIAGGRAARAASAAVRALRQLRP